jgi:hypothetical protein
MLGFSAIHFIIYLIQTNEGLFLSFVDLNLEIFLPIKM